MPGVILLTDNLPVMISRTGTLLYTALLTDDLPVMTLLTDILPNMTLLTGNLLLMTLLAGTCCFKYCHFKQYTNVVLNVV